MPYELSFWTRVRKVERRQWWLWASAIVITLLLTIGMESFSFLFELSDPTFSFTLKQSVRGLVGLVFLFDLYTIYQQLQIHRIRRQLSDQEQMFRLITENAEDLITVVDREGNRLYDSPGYNKLGYSNKDLGRDFLPEQIHPDEREALIAARMETFENGRRSTRGISLPAQRRGVAHPRIYPQPGAKRALKAKSKRSSSSAAILRSASSRKSSCGGATSNSASRKKWRLWGACPAGIAHDFNNLLGVIIGYSESIEHRVAPNDPLRKSAEEIRKAGERAASLTHQLLAFSRQRVLQPQILDLNALVTDMGKMLRRLIGMHIELTTNLATDLERVKAEQSQIEQVIVNLVVNARDAMPDGGKLLIETSNLDVNENFASDFPVLQPGPYVLLSVTDTGVGMDDDTRRHIFEPFFTTKGPGKGTGLGLATVYGVAKQSGGGVTVDSEPGKGSTFKIYLPQTQESAVAPAPDETVATGSMGTGTILLVEDEEALLNLTAERLKECGYNVLPARDGIHALEIARSYNEPIHLLLTDIMMPRMGGLALARSMSELRPGIRVVFMTGHAERDGSDRDALRSGAESIQKPFSHEQLIRLVRSKCWTRPKCKSRNDRSSRFTHLLAHVRTKNTDDVVFFRCARAI